MAAKTEPHRTLEIPDETLRRLAEQSLAEAQVGRLAERLAEALRRTADPTEPNAYLSGLREQRDELLAKHAPAGITVDIAQRQLDRAVLNIGDLLFPWSVLELPVMTEGIYQAPGTPDTSGDLSTKFLSAGGLAYFDVYPLNQDGTGGPAERWWVHNWRDAAVFPAAPASGRLYYRFAVDALCDVYLAPVEAGSIRVFVTTGTTSDVVDSPPPNEWTTWQTVGWPFIQSLPVPLTQFDLSGSVTVTGSIPVNAGNYAAVALIYGTIISAAGGYVQLIDGGFGTRRVGTPGSAPVDDGKIEYRFEPDWWIQAVSGRLENAPSAN